MKSCINLGLNKELKQAFSNVNKDSIIKPCYIFTGIPDPFLVAGISSGDGSFGVKITRGSTTYR